ncbi:MAG TPA: cupredoxin family copper-binding protein [Mycobacteriales bacterium]|nr:cupredoxin family copper-binding protein [Mycobacteriales bacterium]
MTHVRRAATLAVGLLLAATVTACGGSSSGAGIPHVSGPKVVIKGYAFNPATLKVKVGATVTFVQEDTVPHNATGSGDAAFINSPTLTRGQTYTVTFRKPGTYPYICSIHPYMRGTVVVSQ